MIARLRFFRSAAAVLALGILAGLQPRAEALPPDAPTGLKVDGTLAGDGDETGKKKSFRITWVDNAFNEEGYMIDARIGETGAFTTVSYLPVNTQVGIVTLPLVKDPAATAALVVQFRVTAYKRNGAAIEMSARPTVNFTVTEGTGAMSAPTGLTKELVGDGTLNLKWTETSTNEMYFQVLFKKTADTNLSHVGYVYFNTTEIPLQMGLEPGVSYDFAVRATREAPGDGNSFTDSKHIGPFSNVVQVVAPALSPPTELSAEVTGETTVKLTWKDNSKNETGYKIESMTGTATVFTSLGTVSANTTVQTVPAFPASTTKWRVRAVYQTSGMTTAIESTPSNEVTKDTLFPAPSELTATSSARAGAVELTWKDNSTSEAYFDILTRVAGSTDEFVVAMRCPANTTTALVTNIGTAESPPALVIGTEYEFKVQGRFLTNSGSILSDPSAPASAKALIGITSRFYQPATVGVAFEYGVTTSPGRTGWSVTGLPPGLTFSNTTGYVTGTPTTPGVYVCPMTATFGETRVAETTLTLRVLRALASPSLVKNVNDVTIAPNTEFSISLADKFADPDSEQAARLTLSIDSNNDGKADTVDVVLYPSLAPEGVANFLGYVNAGSYDGVAFHRSIPGFVIQGGGFKPVAAPKTFESVTPRPSPKNEPGISNVRGTLSAAKQGNNPHSATHDFFVNLGANNDPENANSLDNQNGGFTVFGRVAGNGMSVVDSIAALPTGDYVDKNDYTVESPVYDATLDKRVIVDGSISGFEDFPMYITGSGATAPADMDVNKAVRILSARQISPVVYTVAGNSSPDVVAAAISGNTVVLRGLTAGSSHITVQMADLDGHSASDTFTVTVVASYKAPVITRHPVSVAVAPFGKATFKVSATGTSLSYQWRKNEVNISGANSPSLTISDVTSAKTGNYDVLVGNATTTLLSNGARLDLKSAPSITANPVSLLLEVGDPLELTVESAGAPAPKFAWTRDGKTVAKQTLPTLSIEAAKLTDGGVYKATATNPSGKASSGEASVCVVDPATVVTTVKEDGKAVLKAGVAGPVVSYQWLKDGVDMEEDEEDETRRIVGTKTGVLTISNASLSGDSGAYTCRVTFPDGLGMDVTGVQKLAVVVPPVLNEYTAATGVVGYDYDFAIPYDQAVSKTPTSFSILELPMGLKLDKKTGHIYGRPLRAGTYRLSTVIGNAAGQSQYKAGTLTILPMPQSAVGTFVAAIEPTALNGNKGGRLDLTVIDQGSYTGRLTLNADVYPFAGVITYFPGAVAPQSQIIIQRKGKTPVLLYFGMDTGNGQVTGQLTDGTTLSNVLGFRRYWDSIWNPAAFFAGYYVMGITPPASSASDAAVPKGAGFMTMTVGLGGTTSMAGKLPDGTSITSSSIVGPFGQFLLYQSLYKKTGTVLGLLDVGTTNLAPSGKQLKVKGEVSWIKDAQTLASDRTYKAGIGPITMNLLGSTYSTPAARVMGLPSGPGNVQLEFSEGGLGSAAINPNVTFEMRLNNTGLFTAAPNPGKVKLTVHAASGLYNGTFELADATAPKRTAAFQGVIIPKIPGTPAVAATSTTAAVAEVPAVETTANGYFLLAQLPSATPPVTTLKTSPILSGKVMMKPFGITVSAPASLIVNPGENATFTVAAEGQGTLAYQWMKDGEEISGATNASYSLTGVTEAAEGSYTAVVSNGSVSATSAAATLSVNDPLTSVTVTRTPSIPSVSPEATVTFTANPVGTGPFTYQWIKDNANIPGATNSTYVIAAAALSDVGAYKVNVTTTLTPTPGITSAANDLAVGDPVSQVVASRTPAEATIGTGQTVTFSVTALGTAPLTYQWKKGGEPITGATAATYTIPSSSAADNGTYTVLVSNTTTPAGVASNGVALDVTDAVANVVATRTPANTVVGEGMTVTFFVSAQGMGPLTYQWRRNNEPIVGATEATYIMVATAGSEGDYDVVVSNPITTGGLPSNVVPLAVGTPVSNVQASRSPADAEIPAGTAVVFSVSANGSAPLTYQWRKDNVNIEGATGQQFTINSSSPDDDGFYDVVVSNPASSGPDSVVSNVVALGVLDSVRNVTATRTPQDSVVLEGETIIFSASAQGAAPLRYQWRKGGEIIEGATNSTYVITGTTSANGVYDVVVSNDITTGGLASNEVNLTVAAPVTNVTASVFPAPSMAEGTTAVFSVTANGTAPFTYQWRKGTQNIPGATGNTYTIQSVSAGDTGDYDVVVSNILSNGGNSAVSNTVNIQVTP